MEIMANTLKLDVRYCSDGLFIYDGAAWNEVGADVVKCNSGAAAWQAWRFQVNGTTPASATVVVYKKEEGGIWESQGTFDCSYVPGSTTNNIILSQFGYATNNMVTHVDYVKIATGLGGISSIDNSPVNNSNWLETGSTNRWKAFNNVLGSQTEQATKIEYVLTPGAVIDSVALLNLESDTVDIVEIDADDNLVTNGTAWTDATGTTQPTGWDKVKTCSDFTIDGGMIRLTADDTNEGISQTIGVWPSTEYQLLGIYKNTASDIAQYSVYDMTNSADILATTDLTSSTANSSFSYVFTTPAGCTSIKISLLAKASGDIVWFDSVILAYTRYSETVTTGTSKTDVVKLDLDSYTAAPAEAETMTQMNRILADGGTIVDLDYMDLVISTMKAQGIYTAAKFIGDANIAVKKDAGTGAVSILYDISGNNNDAVQAVGANQPIWTAGVQNGKYGIFGGNANTYLVSPATVNQPDTIVVAEKLTATLSGAHFIDAYSGARQIVIAGAGQLGLYAGASLDSGIAANTSPNILVSIFNGSSSELFKNGVSIASGDAGANASHDILIGAGNGAPPTSINGNMLFVAEFNVSLTTTQRQAVDNLLNTYYAIY
jgi:hypothetical protein